MKKFSLVFSREVRKSLAVELKRASLFGGITAAALGVKEGSGLWLLVAGLFFVTLQVMAHLVLALEDKVQDRRNNRTTNGSDE